MIELLIMKYKDRALEKKLDCVFIRINPGVADFNICKEIIKIHRHINQSTIHQTEQKTKKSLIDNLSKRIVRIRI